MNSNSKSMLQELCQKKSWGYPEYKTEKEGPNHSPTFRTTVTVNGISFDSPHPSKLLRNSHSDAAAIALQYFTTSNSSSMISGATTLTLQERFHPPITAHANTLSSSSSPCGHMFKSQLQAYAQKRGLPLPEYACSPDGLPHSCRFSCKVTVAGVTYQSPHLFNTVKDSENAAAKLALTSLGNHSDDHHLPVFKNLLQELAQKQSFPLPTYTSQSCGMSHVPTFVATVHVKGELFQGEIAKTKKQAEMNAAKLAYITITQRDTSQNHEFTPATSKPREATSSDLKSHFTVDSQENAKLKSPLISTMDVLPLEGSEPGRAGDEEAFKSKTSNTVPAAMLKLEQPAISNNSSSEITRKRGQSEIPVDVVKVEQPSVSDNDERRKKVCIFPRKLNMELPPGKTVFSDDRWIAIETCQAETS